jgi:hypothetical protein
MVQFNLARSEDRSAIRHAILAECSPGDPAALWAVSDAILALSLHKQGEIAARFGVVRSQRQHGRQGFLGGGQVPAVAQQDVTENNVGP